MIKFTIQQFKQTNFFILSILFILFSCSAKEESAVIYKSKKNKSTPATAQPEMQPSSKSKISWNIPNGWKEKSKGSMRLGSFQLTDKNGMKAEVSLIVLSGNAGGTTANINRWRGQIGLQQFTEQEINKVIKKVDGKLGTYIYHFIKNEENKQGILAAILNYQGSSLFIKGMGNLEVLKQEEKNFVTFIKGINEN